MIDKLYFFSTDNFLLLVFWQGMWFNVGAIFTVILIAFVFYKARMNKMKNQKAELAQQVVKQSELLTYAIENEQRAIEDAKQANQTKRDLLTRISREVRTPMNGVIGMASLLSETTLSAEQREYCETIRNCGENLLTTVNDILFDDLLAYSKMESGKIGLEKGFDLRNSIEEVLDVFTHKASQTGLELVYQVDRDVPPVIVTHSLWVRQILMNLVENAIRYTRQGEVIVKVQLVKKTGDTGITLEFEVSDTGSGILPDKVKELMQELSQSNTLMERKSGNTAGLAICEKLINLMGGNITIESEVGKGTTVRFMLQVNAGMQVAQNHILVNMKGKKILVIDDNTTSLNTLKSQLEEWSLTAVAVTSGKQALEMIMKVSDFDLMITDMTMPEMDGVSIARAVRKQYPRLPIILLSAEGEESLIKYPGLFNSVMNKPVKQHVLSEHIFRNLKHVGEISTATEQFSKQKLTNDFAQHYPLRILIAEDDRVNQKLAMRVLGKLGYSPDIAQNGKEVLEIVSHVKYDLVLMDVQMPDMDGLEATRMIRLCLTTQPIIIAMTANAMQGDREECINAGMDDYISKPINIEELVILLEKSALQLKP